MYIVYLICKNILIVETGSNRGPLESLKPGRHPASCFSIMDDLLAIGKWGDKRGMGGGVIFKQKYKDIEGGRTNIEKNKIIVWGGQTTIMHLVFQSWTIYWP